MNGYKNKFMKIVSNTLNWIPIFKNTFNQKYYNILSSKFNDYCFRVYHL